MTSSQIPKPGVSLNDPATLDDYLTFEDMYELDERLRSGSYGVVYTCHHKLNAEKQYAVKVLDRTKLKKKDDDGVFREVSIMKELAGVDNVVQLIDFFESPEKLFMVQAFAAGGDVFDRLAQRTLYNEKESRDLAECLLKTIQSLHDRRIVHRDLKPENLLLANTYDDSGKYGPNELDAKRSSILTFLFAICLFFFPRHHDMRLWVCSTFTRGRNAQDKMWDAR